MLAGELTLREDKQAGAKVKELSAQGVLHSCVSIDLEYGYHVVDETLSIIGRDATALVALNLNACQECTDAGLQALAGGCSTLTSLSLYWNVKYTDVGISAVARANPRLQNLSVSGCKFLTDAGAIAITENCTALTTLDLTRCVMTTDKALISAAVNCRNLQTLLLYASASPGDQGVQTVLRNLTNLQVLDLCGAKDLTDEGFEPLLSGQPGQMPSLRRLNLGWCCNLGDKCLTGVGRGCPALLYLYVLGNKKMTMEGLRCISTGCTRLCGLDICGLCDIQDRSLPAISPMFPSLTLLAKLGVAPNYDDV